MSVQKATPDILERGRKSSGLAHALARIGHGDGEAPDWSAEYLSHSDPMVRERALGAAQRLGVLSDALLIDALSDTAQRVRLRALRIAAGMVPDSADAHRRAALSERLVTLVDDSDELVAEAALFALGELITTEPAHLDVIERAARSNESALVREAAVAALGAIGETRSLPAVLAACGDKATVRRRATIALAAFEGPDVDRALDAATRDRDWQVRDIARALHAVDDAHPDD